MKLAFCLLPFPHVNLVLELPGLRLRRAAHGLSIHLLDALSRNLVVVGDNVMDLDLRPTFRPLSAPILPIYLVGSAQNFFVEVLSLSPVPS